MSESNPQTPEPHGTVITITSLEQFKTEIARDDIVTCVLAYSSACPISSSDTVYDGYNAMAGEVEFQAGVQFLRYDVAEVPEVTRAMGIRVLPFTQIYWEGNALESMRGSNMDKVRLAVRHGYQTKYIAVTEREKERKGEEGGASAAPSPSVASAKAGAKVSSKPATPKNK